MRHISRMVQNRVFRVNTSAMQNLEILVAYLDKGSNDTQTGKAEILEWTRFAHRVEKRVQEQRDID